MSDYSKGIIYRCTCSEDSKIYYGSTIKKLEERICIHKCHSKTDNRKFYQAIRTHGWDKFTFEIVELYPCKSRDELDRREFDYIERHSPEELFNTEIKYRKTSDETKRVMSESQKEAWKDEKRRKKLSDSLVGNKRSFKGGCVTEHKSKKYWIVIWFIDGKHKNKSFSYGIRSGISREEAEEKAREYKNNLVF